ncbi:hypothetical protein [Burkholderia ubonensis]|uniref:hypothetical protein n=1 Tax=Burkholderia ubonensis TaxID=101571 RepID=UPI0007583425|nr:hypothetical protein [Burkholderia ubonensis]KUZ78274.1 hypothetical protein WI37_11055 [Burkholderia ubonensis]
MNRRPNPQKAVDDWNARVSVGATVEYSEVRGDPPKTFTTRTAAEVLSGHTAVVWLNGKSGCVAISHCTPV